MQYKFKCPNCGNQRLIEIAISDYDQAKYRQVCSNCGSTLERVLEWQGYVPQVGGYSDVAGKASWQF